jgi:transcription elongation GreA/GreB family factor
MVFKRLQELLKHWRRPHKPSEVEVKRQRHLGADYEDTMMAVAFAEAGAQEEALELLQRRGRRKILVLGQEDTFSDAVMDYATLLAERLGYELVALSVGTPAGRLLSPYGKHMQEEFQRQALAAAAVLEQKAAQKNIPCTHVVKFGDVAKAVEEINREYRRIELVITDSPSKREELHARVNVPVFSLKTYR